MWVIKTLKDRLSKLMSSKPQLLTTRSQRDMALLRTFIRTPAINDTLWSVLEQDPATGQYWLGYSNEKWTDYQAVTESEALAILGDPADVNIYPAMVKRN